MIALPAALFIASALSMALEEQPAEALARARALAEAAAQGDANRLLGLPELAAKLVQAKHIDEAVQVASMITRPSVARLANRVDRLILFVTRARVYYHAGNFREALQAYSEAVHNGLADGEASILQLENSPIDGEVLDCARKALEDRSQPATSELIQVGLALEEIDRGVRGHIFLAKLMFAPQTSEAGAQVESAWLRILAVSPPAPSQFTALHATGIGKACDNNKQLLICDVKDAYQGAKSFSNAEALKRHDGLSLFPRTRRERENDYEIVLGDFCAFLVRLARYRMFDRDANSAFALAERSWALNGNIDAAFLLSALFTGNPGFSSQFASVRQSLEREFEPYRIRGRIESSSEGFPFNIWPELTDFMQKSR